MEETFYKPQNETKREENDIMIVSKPQFTDVFKLKNDINPKGNG